MQVAFTGRNSHVVCLFIGTVMTFGMHYWEKTIPREEAIPVEAVYQSCRATYSRSSIKEILVRFSDFDQQAIDSACATEELYDTIKDLVPGTKVSLLLHPNSATILDMRVGDQVFLDFDLVVEALRKEVIGFTVLGILLYLGAVAFCFPWFPGLQREAIAFFGQKAEKPIKSSKSQPDRSCASISSSCMKCSWQGWSWRSSC